MVVVLLGSLFSYAGSGFAAMSMNGGASPPKAYDSEDANQQLPDNPQQRDALLDDADRRCTNGLLNTKWVTAAALGKECLVTAVPTSQVQTDLGHGHFRLEYRPRCELMDGTAIGIRTVCDISFTGKGTWTFQHRCLDCLPVDEAEQQTAP